MTPGRSSGLAVFLALGVATAAPIAAAPPATARAQPAPGTWFEHAVHRTVSDGTGEYAGYSDSLDSEGRYEITAADPERVSVHAQYRWHFSSSEKNESGSEDRTTSFQTATRLYESRTDLDDYDRRPFAALAAWMWIPTNVAPAQQLPLLEHVFALVSTTSAVTVGTQQVSAIEVASAGTGHRDDDYGVFDYTYTDRYWFDAATGMVLASAYEEHDTGSYHGLAAGFVLRERFELQRASYAPWLVHAPYVHAAPAYPTYPTDTSSQTSAIALSTCVCWGVAIALVSLFGGLLFLRLRGRASGPVLTVPSLGSVQFQRSTDPNRPLPGPADRATTFFAPFAEDFARKALLAGDRVEVAVAGGSVVGIGTRDSEADVGTIFCAEPLVTETLRSLLGTQDFFSEIRHPVSDELRTRAAARGVSIASNDAYNIFETYQVLKLEPVAGPTYDPALVTRLRDTDVAEAERLTQDVFRVPTTKWLRASLQAGDIGFVARVDGRIVGFALATCIGSHGRVHALTVHPDFRGRGIANELMRARLRVLADLGASDVITEIAHWNLPSLQVALSNGFRQIGAMYVETVRTMRIERVIVRR